MGKYFLDMFGFSLALTMVVELAVAFLFRRCWAGKSAVGSAVESAAAGKGTRLARKGRLPEDVLFAHSGRVLALVMLVNLLTNPLAVLLCWLGKVYLPFFLAWPVQLVVEAGAVAVEAYVYRSFSGKSGWRIGHPMALAVTTNICSWLLGILAMAVKRQTWFHMLTLWLELLLQ